MTKLLQTVAFDADDTLWENEEFFRMTHDRFADLLTPYVDQDDLQNKLLEAERKNIGHYGYGIKGFMLSMIETAVDVSNACVPASVIQEILTLGQDMLAHPINLLPDVEDTLPKLAEDYRLILITKGDLLHQEQKVARSGLGEFFEQVEIVSEKSPGIYTRIFADTAAQSVMVGNSMKSDIIPALDIGAAAIHVPAKYEWELEKADDPVDQSRFFRIRRLGEIDTILPQIFDV